MIQRKRAIILLIIVLLVVVNFLSPLSVVQASAEAPQPTPEDPIKRFQPNTLDYILGIPLYMVKVLFIAPGILVNLVLTGIASVAENPDGIVTIEGILFNRVGITNIDFFSAREGNMGVISQTIAGFYVAIRNLAIALSLAVLVYIGVHMAINSSAEAQAKYKQMLTNWFVGFGIIFILHYFMVAVIKVNNLLISGLGGLQSNNNIFMSMLLKQAWDIPFTTSLASRNNVFNFTSIYFYIPNNVYKKNDYSSHINSYCTTY